MGFPLIPAIFTAAAGGIAAGFLLPSVAFSMLHLHQGYNLYNMGLTCGFLSLFAAALIKGLGHTYTANLFWYSEYSPVLIFIIPVLSLFLIISGIANGGAGSFKNLKEVLKIPGRLPSDFVDLGTLSGALINSGMLGLFGSVYIYIIDAPFKRSCFRRTFNSNGIRCIRNPY